MDTEKFYYREWMHAEKEGNTLYAAACKELYRKNVIYAATCKELYRKNVMARLIKSHNFYHDKIKMFQMIYLS